jgi:hypothetical protein
MLGLARSQSGISGRSLAEIDDALAKAREIGDRLTEGEVLRARAVVLAADESPDWEAVQADFEASVSLFERLGTRPYLARALRDYGLALEAVGRVLDGKEKLEEAERLFTAMGVRH